jgi:probable aminopeptidase NPEPL1
MVDRPAAELNAETFAEEAERSLKSLKTVSVTHIVADDLLEAGLGGLHAVGRTAVVDPRLLVLEYTPAVAKGKEPAKGPHVALVGKGVVYDTGGLSLKGAAGMAGMKCDMGGAAAVVGAFQVLARGRYPYRLSCVVPLAENAIGPNAYRPDDILKMHSGKTVEINNTDAEGRLLLGDGVSYAARVLKADLVVDAATLTGAQLVATGKTFAAVFSNRDGVEALAVRAGRASGDVVCPLPFAPELHSKEFKSEVADMMNSVHDRMNAQASCAATFVWSHIEKTGVPWLHVDLAGPAFPSRRGTGYGVALMSQLCLMLESGDLDA